MTTMTISGPGLDGRSVHATSLASGPTETRNIEDPATPITAAALADLLSGGASGSGKHVTASTAMKVGAVFACVRVISYGIARMPYLTYERTEEGRQRASNHPIYRLLKFRPNPSMSSFSFRVAVIANALLKGNGYAEIVRRAGRPTALFPIESERVDPYREDGQLKYRVIGEDGLPITMLPRDILHVPGLSFDGVRGLSVVGHAKQTMGAALAADEFAGNLIRNGLRPSGVFQHPGTLGPEGLASLRASLQALLGGPTNAGRFIILEEGMTWAASAMPLEDAQFIESSQFRVEDICRWFGVPPHKVQHLLRSTNNNIEQQSLDFLGDTLAPWVEALDQEVNYKLFPEEEWDRYYAEHLTQAVVQLDTAARVALYKGLRDVAGINADEIRDRENLNRLPEGRGRQFYVPSNLMPAPTPEQADKLLEAWIKKGLSAGKAGEPDQGGEPKPDADDKVAKTD